MPDAKPTIGVIADDVTGGTDVAVALRRRGLRTLLFFGTPPQSEDLPSHDALVIALKTRMLPPLEAVDLSLEAHRWLQSHGVDLTYFKYCSTFDSTSGGNIGPVLDALVAALNTNIVVTTPSSPEHGRTQYAGQLFVGDSPLDESHMRHHPLTPMKDSDLRRLFSQQSPGKAVLINHESVRKGAHEIRHRADQAAASGARYAFIDAVSDEDLTQIGLVAVGERLAAGAAGLAGGIAAAINELYGTSEEGGPAPDAEHGPAAVIAGSCSARTLEQIERMHRAGRPAYFLDAASIGDANLLAANALEWFDGLPPNSSPIIYSSVEPVLLSKIQLQLGVQGSAEILENATGLIAQGLTARGVRRLIAAGGETCGAVVTALGITGGLVGNEADQGVPWIHTRRGEQKLFLLLKSGNFGDPDLLVRASAPAPVNREGRVGPA
ncbi:3-oxo-tetronate kinase [Pseudarthrobacter sp. NamE5]|uniref:3-oxo-tetronate kinase n=1 Tax=Pseudarthrobacter sp. NamE5 TaxID=2576839 RepID=UPI001F0D9505|nr:3-oxo-tetronate kinase [Pseudarthrobacter sp. NamE5]